MDVQQKLRIREMLRRRNILSFRLWCKVKAQCANNYGRDIVEYNKILLAINLPDFQVSIFKKTWDIVSV